MRRLLLLVFLGCALGCVTLTAAEEGGGASSEPSPIWKWANFLILAAGLGYVMAKNLPPFFHSRTGDIQKGIAEAQQMKLDAENRAAQMDTRLKALGADIETFRTQAAAEMQQEGERIRQETAAQIKKLEQQAEAEVEAAGKAARRELKEYAATLALDLAEQRIKARLDAAAESAIVDGFVNDLSRQGSRN